MSVHDLYAVIAHDLEAGNDLLSGILHLDFVGHNSHYFGNYDLAELPGGTGSLKLQPNRNPDFDEARDSPEERFMEHRYSAHALLLYVDVEELAQAKQFEETLLAHTQAVKLLERELIEM